jgi:hypothetical protein
MEKTQGTIGTKEFPTFSFAATAYTRARGRAPLKWPSAMHSRGAVRRGRSTNELEIESTQNPRRGTWRFVRTTDLNVAVLWSVILGRFERQQTMTTLDQDLFKDAALKCKSLIEAT